jgi:heme exporter protein C
VSTQESSYPNSSAEVLRARGDFFGLEALTLHFIPRIVLPVLTIPLVLVALYLSLIVAPDEATMGPVYRTLYFHAACATAAYLMIALLTGASVLYLVTDAKKWDFAAAAAGQIAFVLCAAVLGSGMIWGHVAWNTWWKWEPRLVSTLVLWMILGGYLLLRLLADDAARMRRSSAVLGILAAINVPIVVYSVKLLPHSEQLHPQVVANQGLTDPMYVAAFVTSICAVCLLALWCFTLLSAQLLLKDQIESVTADGT